MSQESHIKKREVVNVNVVNQIVFLTCHIWHGKRRAKLLLDRMRWVLSINSLLFPLHTIVLPVLLTRSHLFLTTVVACRWPYGTERSNSPFCISILKGSRTFAWKRDRSSACIYRYLFCWHVGQSFTGLYHCRLKSGVCLALIERLGCISKW